MPRIKTLDVLRGFAVLGILFMNIYYHSVFELGYVPLQVTPLSDNVIEVINAFFIDGRFRALFCLLFGVSLAILYDKHGQDDAFSLLKSRLNWLLIFGFIHSVFIFSGDILVNYALAGLIVYREIGSSQEVLLKKAKTYFAIGFSLILLFALIPNEPIYRDSDEYFEIINTWQSGYGEQLIQQIVFTIIMFVFSWVCFIWITAGIVLFGVYLYRADFFNTGLSTKQLLASLLVVITISSIDALLRVNYVHLVELTMSIATFSGLVCALMYCHVFIKLNEKLTVLNSIFAPAGRMAFTLYILQSIVFALFFRYFSPEFVHSATRLDYIYLCLMFSVFQLVFAFFYLKLFKSGPIEWLWRKAYSAK